MVDDATAELLPSVNIALVRNGQAAANEPRSVREHDFLCHLLLGVGEAWDAVEEMDGIEFEDLRYGAIFSAMQALRLEDNLGLDTIKVWLHERHFDVDIPFLSSLADAPTIGKTFCWFLAESLVLDKDPSPPLTSLLCLDLTMEPKPAKYLIENLIVEAGRLLLVAPSGVGKSWLALDIALSIVLGQDWLNQDRFSTVEDGGRVILVEEEAPSSTLHYRLAKAARGKGFELRQPEILNNLKVFSRQGVRTHHRTWRELITEIEDFSAKLVILDSAVRVMTGSDNEAEAVALFWNRVDMLQRKGAAVLVVHHAGHLQKGRARGSTDWRAGTDIEIVLSEGSSGTLRELTWTKVRDGETPAPMILDYQFKEDEMLIVDPSYGGLGGAGSKSAWKKAAVSIAIRQLIKESLNLTTGEIVKTLQNRGASRSTIYRALKAMGMKTDVREG